MTVIGNKHLTKSLPLRNFCSAQSTLAITHCRVSPIFTDETRQIFTLLVVSQSKHRYDGVIIKAWWSPSLCCGGANPPLKFKSSSSSVWFASTGIDHSTIDMQREIIWHIKWPNMHCLPSGKGQAFLKKKNTWQVIEWTICLSPSIQRTSATQINSRSVLLCW